MTIPNESGPIGPAPIVLELTGAELQALVDAPGALAEFIELAVQLRAVQNSMPDVQGEWLEFDPEDYPEVAGEDD